MAVMPGAPAGLPPGVPPDPTMGGAPPAPGASASPFPSADPNAVLALLSQLIAHDQQALGEAQVAAVGGAFSQLLGSQPDPMAQAAATGQPQPVGPGPSDAGYS